MSLTAANPKAKRRKTFNIYQHNTNKTKKPKLILKNKYLVFELKYF